MELLKITVTPTKYELEITPARLEYQQDFIPNANTRTEPGNLKIETKQIQLSLDTYEARRSLGFANPADLIRNAAKKVQDAFSQNLRDTVQEGKDMARIEDGVTIAGIIQQKMLQQPESYTAFLPSTGADLSWTPGNIQTDYQPGEVTHDWQITQNVMNYIPGSVKIKVVQQGDVNIEYLGRPMYIPPSADPEYEEEDAS